MADISQTTFSDVFLKMKIRVISFKIHWSFFLSVRLMIIRPALISAMAGRLVGDKLSMRQYTPKD